MRYLGRVTSNKPIVYAAFRDKRDICGVGVTRRYSKHIYEKLYPEKAFLTDLDMLINAPNAKRQKKNLKNASLDNLSKSIKEAISNFQ